VQLFYAKSDGWFITARAALYGQGTGEVLHEFPPACLNPYVWPSSWVPVIFFRVDVVPSRLLIFQ
jgi:hypothetical protein